VLHNLPRCRDEKGNGARFNLGGYCNAAVDRFGAEALTEIDAVRRARLLLEAFEIIHGDAGFIPLHQQTLAWAMARKVEAARRADNQIKFGLFKLRETRGTTLPPADAAPTRFRWGSRAEGMRLEHAVGRGGKTGELFSRADRAADEFAAAVRATPARQAVASAVHAEGALEGADQGIGCVRG
jgi:hypothetical protein